MSDQPIQIPLQATLEGTGAIISELENLKKVVASLADVDVSGKLKTQVQAVSTAAESMTSELVRYTGAQAKAMSDAAASGANGAVGAVKRARQEMQAEYEKMSGLGWKLDLGALANLKTRGVSLMPEDSARLTEALNVTKLETEVTRYAEKMRALGEKVSDTQRRADNWFNSTVDKMEKSALAEKLKAQAAQEARAAEDYAARVDILNAQIKSAKARQQEALESNLVGIKNASKQMWADKKAQETADAEAYVRTLDVLNAQIKAAKDRQQATLDQQMGVLSRTARAQYNQALSTAGTYSVSEGSGIGLEKNTAAADTAQKGLNASQKEGAAAAAKLREEKAKLREEMKDLHSAARGLASGFGAMWLTWGNVLPLMAGAGISGAIATMIKSGSEVDQQLTAMRVLGGESAASVAALNSQMLELSKTGPYGPKETAAAMKTLVLAGMDAKDVAVSLKDVLNFSVAGDTGIQQAADTLTTVATAFGLGGGKSGMAGAFTYVGDIISVAAAESKASVEDMSNSFKTASAINQQFGVSLEDTAVGLALLANAGIKGTAAGTSLRNMVSDLSGRTKKATDAMKELGVEAIDPATGKIKSLDVVMSALMSKLQDKATPAGAMKYLQTIFDERGAKEAFAIFDALQRKAKDSGDSVTNVYADLKDKVMNAAGFSAIAAAEMALTPMNQMKSVAATLQGTLVDAFESMRPYLTETAEHLKEIFSSDKFKSGLQDLISLVGNLVTFALDHAKAIVTVVAAYASLRTALTVLSSMAMYQAAVAATAKTASVAVEELGIASRLAAAANPLLLGLTAVVTAAAGAFMLYEMYLGQSTQASEDSETPRKSMLKSLEAERDRLREINEARAENITVEELRARKATGPSGDTGIEAQIAAAKKRLDDAKLVNKSSEAEAQSAYDALVTKANGDRQALIRARYQVMAEAGRIADDQRADQKKRIDEQAARFHGTSNGPANNTGHGANDNSLQNILKQYDTEMGLIKSLEGDKLKVLNGMRSANLMSQEGFYAHEIALADETSTKELAQIRRSYDEYADAYAKKYSAIENDPKEKDKKGKLAALLNDALSADAKFTADEQKLLEAANTRKLLQEIAFQGRLKKIKDDARAFQDQESLNDAKKVRSVATADQLRYATPDQAARISAEANERERLTDVVQKYDTEIKNLNQSLSDDIDLAMSQGPVTRQAADAIAQQTKNTMAGTAALKAQRDVLLGQIPDKVNKAGNAADEETRKAREAESNWRLGARRSLDEYARASNNVAKGVGDVFAKAFKGMEDGLLNFVKTGKISFDDLANSIIDDLIRIAIQKNITGPLAGAMGSVFGNGPITSQADIANIGNGQGFANGGVFMNSPSLSTYSNGVYDSPKMFAFAKGAGVFAEAGPEAIMPLTRGPNGRLGVQASGAVGGNSMVVNIIESPEKAGKVERKTENGVDMLDVFVNQVKASIANDINRGSGAVPGALNRTYGLNRAAGAY